MNQSILEIGASAGAAGAGEGLCPYMLDAPIATAHPTNKTPLNLLQKREIMRLSSATILEVTQKNLRLMENKPGKVIIFGRPKTVQNLAVFKVPYFAIFRAQFSQ